MASLITLILLFSSTVLVTACAIIESAHTAKPIVSTTSAQSTNTLPSVAEGKPEEGDEVFFRIGPAPSKKEVDDIKSQAREFLWTRWSSKCTGLLTLEQYTTEGEKMVSSFEFRSNELGKCAVYGKVTGYYTSRKTGERTTERTINQTRKFTAASIDRIEMPEDRLSDAKVIPKDSIRSPDTYMIRLVDKDNRVAYEL